MAITKHNFKSGEVILASDFNQLENDIDNSLKNYLPLSGGTVSGEVNGITASTSDSSTKFATTKFVNNYTPCRQFSTFEQIGLSTPTNILSVLQALPQNSTLQTTIENSQIEGLAYGILTVHKGHSGIARNRVEFRQSLSGGSNIEQVGACNTNDGTVSWKQRELIDSKGANFIRYVSGLQICWGGSNISAETTYTFAQPFNSLPIVTTSGTGQRTVWLTAVANENFKVTASGFTCYVRWIAIGYWK